MEDASALPKNIHSTPKGEYILNHKSFSAVQFKGSLSNFTSSVNVLMDNVHKRHVD